MTPSRVQQNLFRDADDELDSESSDDEELCAFWHNLRRLQVQSILAASTSSCVEASSGSRGSAQPKPLESEVLPCGRGAWMEGATLSPHARSQPAFCEMPRTPPQPVRPHVDGRRTAELLRREAAARRGTSMCSPSAWVQALQPGEAPPMRGVGAMVGLRLWHCPADLTLEVLCFVHADDVCSLLLTCKTARAACCIHTPEGWYTVLPHLILSSKMCAAQLKRVWWPRTLWLEGRDLDAAACQSLLNGLECTGASAAKALLALDLRNTKLASPISLVSVARSCRSLCSLNLSRTRLRDLGASHLLGGLVFDPLTGGHSPHTRLRFLSLEDNRLTAAIGRELARVILETPLEVLLLGSNDLRDVGAGAIADAIAGRKNSSCVKINSSTAGSVRLTRLDISRNSISSSGFAAVVSSLASNRSLRILEAGGNEKIGPDLTASSDCATSVSSGLMAARGLAELHIWKCGLGDSAFNLIAESLPPNIAVVNLASNLFSSSLKRLIVEDGVIRL